MTLNGTKPFSGYDYAWMRAQQEMAADSSIIYISDIESGWPVKMTREQYGHLYTKRDKKGIFKIDENE